MAGKARKNRGLALSPWVVVDLLLLAGGGGLALLGFCEYAASAGASKKPVPANLAELEAGKPLPDKHIVIGRHIAVHTAGVYSFETKREFGEPKPKPDDRLNHTYYPIISESHPYLQQLAALTDKYGGLENVPQNVPLPTLKSFAVLVKSHGYNTVSQLPKQIRPEPRVQGMVVRRISLLDFEERQLLRESLPDVDFDKMIILEEGRQPTSPDEDRGVIIFGVCVALVGIGLFCTRLVVASRRRKRSRRKAAIRHCDDIRNGI
jgi:hypothetical protein